MPEQPLMSEQAKVRARLPERENKLVLAKIEP